MLEFSNIDVVHCIKNVICYILIAGTSLSPQSGPEEQLQYIQSRLFGPQDQTQLDWSRSAHLNTDTSPQQSLPTSRVLPLRRLDATGGRSLFWFVCPRFLRLVGICSECEAIMILNVRKGKETSER